MHNRTRVRNTEPYVDRLRRPRAGHARCHRRPNPNLRVTTGVTRRSRQASTARRRPSRPVAVQLQGAVRTVYTQLIVPDVQCGTVARPRLLVALCYYIIGPHVHPDSLLPSVARGAP